MQELGDDEQGVEMDILASSFLAVNDSAAWAQMMAAWDQRIVVSGYDKTQVDEKTSIQRHYKAIESLLQKVGLPSAEDPVEFAVSEVATPAMVINRQLRVTALNPEGRRFYGLEQAQLAGYNWVAQDHRAIVDQVFKSASIRGNSSHAIVRTLPREGDAGLAECYLILDPQTGQQQMAVRELSTHWNQRMTDLMQQAFGLTLAEVDICQLLFSGKTVDTIAAARGVSLRTVRFQLSSVFAKSETRNQVELVRMLAMLSARLSDAPAERQLIWSDPYGREQKIHLSGGRVIAHSWLGDPNGRPALFLPGIVNGYLYPDEFEAHLKASGVCLHVLSRPGAGGSSVNLQRDPLEELVEAIVELCHHLGLKSIAGAAVHGGNIALLKSAADHPEIFSHLVTIGRFFSYSGEQMRHIAPVPRTFLWMALHAKWAATVVGQLSYRALQRHGPDWYVDRAYRDMPFDYASSKKAELAPLLRNACAYNFAQGPEIFFRDFELRRANFTAFLPKISVPIHWLRGNTPVYRGQEGEGLIKYDQELVARLLREYSNLTYQTLDNAGDLIAYQHPVEVADAIAKAVHS